MNEIKKQAIDIREVIGSKNPTLLKMLPGFVIGYVKRIIHEDQINAFIAEHGSKTSFDFVDAVIQNFRIQIKVVGAENIIAEGGCIFASNHPLGGMDAMALLQVMGWHRRDVKFIVNDILLQLKNLEQLFIGVNKHGKNSAQAIEDIDALYASHHATLIFPAGLVSRKQGGTIKDLQWRKSFIVKSKKYHSRVVPVYIEGRNSNWFYNLANWRKRLGIAANIEMLYLMDEMYYQVGKTITITFGKPIPSSAFTVERSDGEWADKMREHVYDLKENPNKIFS